MGDDAAHACELVDEMNNPSPLTESHFDILLVGAGIMSATLAAFLKELQPDSKLVIFKRLGSAAEESSNAWNNAGTGHAALCELNYTPQRSDGSVDISKALEVNGEFDLSRQVWAYLVKKGAIKDPQSFIHPVPHCSFVHGPRRRRLSEKAFRGASRRIPLTKGWSTLDDRSQIEEWFPLVMEGRDPGERPSYGHSLANDAELLRKVRSDTAAAC